MKILQTAQKNFEILGICSNQPRFNGKCVVAAFIYGLGAIFSTMFVIRDAETFQDYTNNLYITTALIVGVFCTANTIFKAKELFVLVDNIEKSFDRSKIEYIQYNC